MRRTDVVEKIRKVVQEVAPTAKTILFGSEARDDARPDNDIDLLILMDGAKLPLECEEVVTLPLYELELKIGVTIHSIVMIKKLWDNRPFKTPFYISAVNEGIML